MKKKKKGTNDQLLAAIENILNIPHESEDWLDTSEQCD